MYSVPCLSGPRKGSLAHTLAVSSGHSVATEAHHKVSSTKHLPQPLRALSVGNVGSMSVPVDGARGRLQHTLVQHQAQCHLSHHVGAPLRIQDFAFRSPEARALLHHLTILQNHWKLTDNTGESSAAHGTQWRCNRTPDGERPVDSPSPCIVPALSQPELTSEQTIHQHYTSGQLPVISQLPAPAPAPLLGWADDQEGGGPGTYAGQPTALCSA
ncbi:hypothetical protein CKAH01_00842 [Colletotrichum kahawae]|uniref:Uncharacterized protein n=1 Tax=Colletotrichum kahawae TaxID=34407 RepID=A0AAD9YM39_COLKA|nr:hypothetical protein CKAH01_00842 [Colletotrichum kahawae]